MRFLPTLVDGVVEVEIDDHDDNRGIFARTFCAETFRSQGMAHEMRQCSISFNRRRGTLRGMHYQAAPSLEAKLVRATRGRVYDVALDLREGSSTYLKWASVVLDSELRNALYIPAGCAHGFITLENDCEIFYQMSQDYEPDLARCVRWDDPVFAIAWPFNPTIMNERDAICASYIRSDR